MCPARTGGGQGLHDKKNESRLEGTYAGKQLWSPCVPFGTGGAFLHRFHG